MSRVVHVNRCACVLCMIALLLLGCGLLACQRRSAPEEERAAVSLPPASTPNVQTKTVTRNVYDGSIKVGELTFTVEATTVVTTECEIPAIRVSVSSLVFEVTNRDYMTAGMPARQREAIPVARGAKDDWEQLEEEAGLQIGSPDRDIDRYYTLRGSMCGLTWFDFFNDPADTREAMGMWVTYYNTNTVTAPGKLPFDLTVKEATR